MVPHLEFNDELKARMSRNSDAGRQKGDALLKEAAIARGETIEKVLEKLTRAARKTIGTNFAVDAEPFGFTLREQPADVSADVTGTVQTSCSFNPWDGCTTSPDW